MAALRIRTLLTTKAFATVTYTYSKCIHYYSILKESVIADQLQQVDFEKIRDNCHRHTVVTGNKISALEVAKKELDEKYDQVIKNFNAKESKRLKVIQLEHSFLFSEGYAIPAPEDLKTKHWLQAMLISTMEERMLYYIRLEEIRENKTDFSRTREKTDVPERNAESYTDIFYDAENLERETRWRDHRLASAMQFGIPLVVDMDLMDTHSLIDMEFVSQQLWDMYCVNHSHPQPFHLVFTCCPPSHPLYRQLVINHMLDSSMLATFTEKNHLALFPREKLIYLSTQSKSALGVFDPSLVYILGAYHDPLVRKKCSFARAQEQNLLNFRLPITENVRWQNKISKDLDMDKVTSVLLSVKEGMSWKEAFVSNIPSSINFDPPASVKSKQKFPKASQVKKQSLKVKGR